MASIVIKTTEEEQTRMLKAVEVFKDKVVSVSDLAAWAGLNQSRARYTLVDLIEQGKVVRTPTKAFNKNYIRYSYSLAEKGGVTCS